MAAEYPVLVADRMARTPNGMKLLVELAEALQAAVIDQGSRMNFPSRHPLNQTQRARAAVAEADAIAGFEVVDYWGTVNALRDQLHRSTRRVAKPTAKLISVSTGDLYIRANYQDFRRMQEVDLAIAADGEATLPALIEAVKRLTTADRRRVYEERVRTWRRQPRRSRGGPRGGHVRLGRESGEHRSPAAPRSGRRSRTTTGHSCRATTAAIRRTGRGGSGTSTSRTSGSDTRAAAESDTARPHQWAAPRQPKVRPALGRHSD